MFNGNNSLVFLDTSDRNYSIALSVYNNNFCHIGSNNYFNGKLNLKCSEQSNIFIGDDCLFSFGVWVRTSDVHLIYNAKDYKRRNYSKSIFIGDHVWVGQDSKVWKGTYIGSGSIIATNAFTTGKKISSNSVWGGNPARLISSDVFFLGNSSHPYTETETKKWSEYPDDKYIYKFDEHETMTFVELEQKIKSLATASERADFLLDFSKSKTKNRFFIDYSNVKKESLLQRMRLRFKMN